jgi:hypothetical protein
MHMMTPTEKVELKSALKKAFAQAIDEIGFEAFKRTSMFGSNDLAFKAAKAEDSPLKQAA